MALDEEETKRELSSYFMREARWEYKISLWPRRCYFTDRWLWLGRHFRLSKVYGGIEVFVDTRWLHREIGTQIKMAL